jgi:hypothetical protein
MMQEYYNILDLDEKASLEDIKKAYKRKAKILHPDHNKSPNAHEQFIELNKAFELLVKYKTTGHISSQTVEDAYQKAQRYAQMRYEEYINSDEYKKMMTLESILNIVLLYWLIGLGFIPCLILYYIGGIIFSAIGFAIYLPIVFYVLKQFPLKEQIQKKEAVDFIKKNITPIRITSFASMVFNLYCFFHIGFRTLVPLSILLLSYPFLGVMSYYLSKFLVKKTQQKRQLLIAIIYAPLLISCFLFINYHFSSAEKMSQTYQIKKGINSTLIELKNDELADDAGVRLFFDYSQVQRATDITYVFRKGRLGLTVISDYKIEKKKP